MLFISFPIDALAVLAVKNGYFERAARLFGTRRLRGFSHLLSPDERAAHEADRAKIRAALGEERFEQLLAEGHALSFSEVLALAKERD
jgi:hypothetical protein